MSLFSRNSLHSPKRKSQQSQQPPRQPPIGRQHGSLLGSLRKSDTPMTSTPTNDVNRKTITDKLVSDCYSKRSVERRGNQIPSLIYNTHISILEYSQYANAPPPPQLGINQVGSVKERVLVLCTKPSGEIALQKGKFNAPKDIYQIGRTWDLHELKAVKKVNSDAMILQLNKDYYWKTNDSDKDAVWKFCRSVTEAYGKQFGKYPQLQGFSVADFKLPATPVQRSISDSNKKVGPGQYSNQIPDMYKDIDFTANGKLPMKPMMVLALDRPGNVAHVEPVKSREPSLDSNRQQIRSQPMYPRSGSIGSGGNQLFSSKESVDRSYDTKSRESPLRNYVSNTDKTPIEQDRDAPESLESAARTGRILQERLLRFSLTPEPQQSTGDALKEFSDAIPPRIPMTPDFGIEEITDDSDVEPTSAPQSISIKKRPLQQQQLLKKFASESPRASQFMAESTQLDMNQSIQDLEKMLDTSINKSNVSLSAGGGREGSVDHSLPVFKIEGENGKAITVNDKYIEAEPSLEPGLNIVKKMEGVSPIDENKIEKDPEVDEIFDEIGWSVKDNSESLIKKLNNELTNVKQLAVQELVSVNLSESQTNDITVSIEEVENLNQIFQKMEIDLKFLTPEINLIDENSHGLQVKFINKKMLYNDLKSILDKVSVNIEELDDISDFKSFDDLRLVGPLEMKLLKLYNAISTIRSDSDQTDGLNSMKALQQYQSKYDKVNLNFVKNFNQFIRDEFQSIIRKCSEDFTRFQPSNLLIPLNRLIVYSGLTYFIKEVAEREFRDLIQFVNSLFSGFLESWIKSKLQTILLAQQQNANLGEQNHELVQSMTSSILSMSMSDSLDGTPLRKSRTLRLSRKMGKFGGLLHDNEGGTQKNKLETIRRKMTTGLGGSEIDDPKLIIAIVEDARLVISYVQYFIGMFFHYDNSTTMNDFGEYLQVKPFNDRRKLIDDLPNIDTVNVDKNYNSSDLISNMTNIFGNFNNIFMKKVNPVELNIPVILLYLENSTINIQAKNQEFLLINFLKKLNDKYKSSWRKFVNSQVELLNNSIIVAKCGVLSSVKNINYVLLITESSIDNRDIRGLAVKDMIDKAYEEISDSLINLFLREDPLLKNHDLDDKEREYRNVSILQNIFYILQQFQDFGNTTNDTTKKLIQKLESIFKQVEKEYFQKQLNKNIGKLVEFVSNYEALEKMHSGKYNKKYVKSMLANYTQKDISLKAMEISKKFEKHFITGNDMVEKDMVDKLWNDLCAVFVDYFRRLDSILRRDFDRDFEYNVTKADIQHIFKSIRN